MHDPGDHAPFPDQPHSHRPTAAGPYAVRRGRAPR
ncbi:hypothetical protein LRR80_00568 [Streptomyces sp. RO-S4]|nr:hypothetical protein [Streptomyces sp. RO-S4]